MKYLLLLCKMENIRGLFDVIESRYKMPIMQIIYEGKDLKTLIINSLEISKALQIDHKYLEKYFAIELNTRTFIDNSRNCIGMKGQYNLNDLRNKLYLFIEIYILCDICKLPEIRYKNEKNKLIKICNSCGNRNIVKEYKLNEYFLKDYDKFKKYIKNI